MPEITASTSVIIGLAAGVAFIALFASMFSSTTPIPDPKIYIYSFTVVIPHGASDPNSGKTFTPQAAWVGWGTTVRWVNLDSVPAFIEADNDSDPDFYNATKNFVLIPPGATFKFNFTKPGEFGYHGKPWQHGIVSVCPC